MRWQLAHDRAALICMLSPCALWAAARLGWWVMVAGSSAASGLAATAKSRCALPPCQGQSIGLLYLGVLTQRHGTSMHEAVTSHERASHAKLWMWCTCTATGPCNCQTPLRMRDMSEGTTDMPRRGPARPQRGRRGGDGAAEPAARRPAAPGALRGHLHRRAGRAATRQALQVRPRARACGGSLFIF